MENPYIGDISPISSRTKMAIVEFKTRVQTRKRITIPSKVNIEEGEEVLVRIERIEPKKEGTG